MALSLGSNIASLNAQTHLAKSSAALEKSYQKISSGSRINHACDDAAGLAIADSLKADSRLAEIAIRNANDGISAVSIADGALETISSILIRSAELAEQAASGTYTSAQTAALNTEFLALKTEIDRISDTTSFNGTNLLSGNSLAVQVGLDGSSAQITIATPTVKVSNLNIATATIDTASNAQTALTNVRTAINTVASSRGSIGASEARLNHAVSNLQTSRENFLAAESQIRDTDVATEAAELTRLNILQQAGVSVLAQANQQPQLVLGLLA